MVLPACATVSGKSWLTRTKNLNLGRTPFDQRESYCENSLKPQLKQLDAYMKDNKFVAGATLTYVDFMFWEILDHMTLFGFGSFCFVLFTLLTSLTDNEPSKKTPPCSTGLTTWRLSSPTLKPCPRWKLTSLPTSSWRAPATIKWQNGAVMLSWRNRGKKCWSRKIK